MSKSEGDNRENNKALNEKMSRPSQLLKLKVFVKYDGAAKEVVM